MLRLNILPQKQKKEIRLKLLYNKLKNIFSVIIIISCAYAILLLLMELTLQMHFISTIDETSLINKSTENYSTKIYDINVQLDEAETIQKNYSQKSILIEFLSQNIKSDISISNLSLNKNNNTLSLTGFSGSRQSLLDLKEVLENADNFSSVNFPISNLLKKNDINFDISAQIDNYDFAQLR